MIVRRPDRRCDAGAAHIASQRRAAEATKVCRPHRGRGFDFYAHQLARTPLDNIDLGTLFVPKMEEANGLVAPARLSPKFLKEIVTFGSG